MRLEFVLVQRIGKIARGSEDLRRSAMNFMIFEDGAWLEAKPPNRELLIWSASKSTLGFSFSWKNLSRLDMFVGLVDIVPLYP